MRNELLAFVEEENRPGLEEVTRRSKWQRKMLEGSPVSTFGSGAGMWVCSLGYVGVYMPHTQPPICFNWNPLVWLIK